MDEPAEEYLKKVRFLSLYNADISYLPEERVFYFNNVIQPVTYSFLFPEARFLVEFNHQVDFTLKGGWVVHENLPKDRIVGFRTIEYSLDDSKSLEAPAVPAQLESIVEEQLVEPPLVDPSALVPADDSSAPVDEASVAAVEDV